MAQRSSVAQTALPYAPRCWAVGRQSHAVLGLEAVPGEGGGATCPPCEWGLLSILLAPLSHFPTLISISKAGQQKAADAHSEPIKNIFLPDIGALLWHVASSRLAVFCGMPVLQLSRGVLGSWWDVHPQTHVPAPWMLRQLGPAVLLAASPFVAGATVV